VRRLLPILAFAAALVLMQWAGGLPLTPLPLVTLVVFAVSVTLARRVRWQGRIFRVRPGSRSYTALLFALFVRHFAGILGTETRRVLVARRLAAPRAWGPGGARSLMFAVAALFGRSLTRAERFYAAQSLGGMAE
jgi:hypothetical protein